MKRVCLLILASLTLLLAGGCGGDKTKNKVEEKPQFLDVVLTVNPEKAMPGEEVTFEATITYGDEEVTDADDVKFEVWRANNDKHEKFQVKHSEKGKYRLNKTFMEEGTYYIISHVTARDMHNMPKKEFVVGKSSKPEEDHHDSNADMNELDDAKKKNEEKHDSTSH
ncbi:FixH family protein [Mesobacillus zeae]|uniref:YtkA-like domain-containing protein n=1 Tax=Mesobacillus zeae TaxID=1917180 RepID=A0A398B7L1_9BACI|nr:FixH family protein [Mesobacillus zeae]RID85521.1 hypothetical protein D1970_08070 [Mesobacillus zeae]